MIVPVHDLVIIGRGGEGLGCSSTLPLGRWLSGMTLR